MNKNKSLSNFFLKINKPYKTPKTSTAILVGALLFLSGCADPDPFGAVSNATVNYYWIGDFDIASDARVAVAVVDRRKEILNSEKNVNFVGVVRDLFGKSFDVITQGGFALVDNIALSIDSGLYGAGIESEVLHDSSLSDTEQVRSDLMHLKANRYVLVVVNEWRSNTLQRTELVYAVDLSIYNPNGTEVLKKTFSGQKVGWDSGFLTPKERNATVLAKLYPETLKEMFENEEVSSALALAANEETVTSSNKTTPVETEVAITNSNKSDSIETEVAVVEGTTQDRSANLKQASEGVSGTYVSDITSNNNWRFRKAEDRKLRITLLQKGNEITGTNKSKKLEIRGIRERDEIRFFTLPSDISSDEIRGKWKISSDGNRLTGNWSHPNGGGKWNLTRIE